MRAGRAQALVELKQIPEQPPPTAVFHAGESVSATALVDGHLRDTETRGRLPYHQPFMLGVRRTGKCEGVLPRELPGGSARLRMFAACSARRWARSITSARLSEGRMPCRGRAFRSPRETIQ